MAGFDALNSTAMQYNNPNGYIPEPSSINVGSPNTDQINTDFYDRKALWETRKQRYFSQLASVKDMPKHFGKKISKYHMIPLIDEKNQNDQGIDAGGVKTSSGNLYGSSKDIGRVVDTLPMLSENGGRVNRVGFSRLQLHGTFDNYGLFAEFTQDALDFDTMSDLYQHYSRELINGAVQMTEAMLQIDLINEAGIELFGGEATSFSDMTGNRGDVASIITAEQLLRLSIQLDDNRCPKDTKMLKGSVGTGTKTVDNSRILYIGSELIPMLTRLSGSNHTSPISLGGLFSPSSRHAQQLMQDNIKSFVPVDQYGYGGDYKEGIDLIHGEIGKIGKFRVVVVPEMLHHAAAGATVTDNASGFRTDTDVHGAERFNLYPMLVVGGESFTTIGFGGSDFKKFKIRKMLPDECADLNDPYGKTGFLSLSFNYGFMALRPERIAVAWSVAL